MITPCPAQLMRDKTNRKFLKQSLHAYFFLLPALIYYLLFYIYPLFFTIYLSFLKWDLIENVRQFIGWQNYKKFLFTPQGLHVLYTTFYFLAGVIPARAFIALFIALLLNQRIPGRSLFRFAYFSPMVISFIAASMIWLWICDPQYGLINFFLNLVGLPKLGWLGDPRWAMPALIILSIWKGVGYYMVIFLAGLQEIPETLYEAATIDGASKFRVFWSITLPLLSRVTTFVLIMSVIFDFRIFEPIYVLTGGGPLGKTEVINWYLYKQGFHYFKMGYASSVAMIGSLIILVFALFRWKTTRRIEY